MTVKHRREHRIANPGRLTFEPLGGNADRRQVGGSHYKDASVQPWDAMRAWMTPEQFKGFLRGNAIKYLARCDWKGGVEDLEKARHYLDKLIEELTNHTLHAEP